MLGWIVRGLLLAAGTITSLFVAREAHQYEIMQMVVAIFLFVLGVAAAAFWPLFTAWLRRLKAGQSDPN
jgi:uncharacterized membrane protein YbhN (UPF0104 family)